MLVLLLTERFKMRHASLWVKIISYLIFHMFNPFYFKKKKYYFYVNLTLCVIFFLVLPKFDVMITTPLYYSLREEDVSGIVTAK